MVSGSVSKFHLSGFVGFASVCGLDRTPVIPVQERESVAISASQSRSYFYCYITQAHFFLVIELFQLSTGSRVISLGDYLAF